jgi:formylglycine-generating enzyme required for sulfatase activity
VKLLLVCMLSAFTLAACSTAASSPPAAVQTGVDPATWVRIAAGPYSSGPQGQAAQLDYDYEIMVTDVTNAQYAAYLDAALAAGTVTLVDGDVVGYYHGDAYHGHKHEERIDPGDYLHVPGNAAELRLILDGARFAAMPGYENHPMVMVTWFGARAFCEAEGGRLPTQAEWEKAARGTDGRAYPWGNELARNQANYYNSQDIFEKVFGKGGDTTPVGYYNGKTYGSYQTLDGASPYGLHDMAGNVWQWTSDVTEGIHYRFMRGGSKADYGYMLRSWSSNNAGPEYAGPSVGFRCARDAK